MPVFGFILLILKNKIAFNHGYKLKTLFQKIGIYNIVMLIIS